MAQLILDVRGVVIPMTDCNMLLPNACVTEVITYSEPQPIADAPSWVLGTVAWRGWRLPLFSFAQLSGSCELEPVSGAKVPVLKAFGGVHKMPYIGVLAQGFPRLTSVTEDNLDYHDQAEDLPPGVSHSVRVNDYDVYIPDLDAIERQLISSIDSAAAA